MQMGATAEAEHHTETHDEGTPPPPPATPARKWKTIDAGPIQVKRVNEAMRELAWLRQTTIELSGVKGVKEDRARLVHLFGTPNCNPKADELLVAIGERFQWSVTKATANEIVRAFQAALIEADPFCKVEDKRRSPEEEQELVKARQVDNAKHVAHKAACEAAIAKLRAKAPSWAKAIILAELDEDKSEPMTDYFAHSTTRHVAIGWRSGAREDFRQLRQAAAQFPETAHLGLGCDDYTVHVYDDDSKRVGLFLRDERGMTRHFSTEALATAAADALPEHERLFGFKVCMESVEHRENYSMGSGNYLKAGHTNNSGWRVRSYQWPIGDNYYHILEDAIPEGGAATPALAPPTAGPGGAFTIEQHRHTKKGFDMWIVVLANRVEEDEFKRLRSAATAMGGWYSRKWGGSPSGFAFKSEGEAAAFGLEHVR